MKKRDGKYSLGHYDRDFSILMFTFVFIIALIIFSFLFFSFLKGFSDKPKVHRLFRGIEQLQLPVLSSWIAGKDALNQAEKNIKAGEGITGQQISDFAVTASIAASRTTCIAPCAVFFDATGTTSTTTTRPFHELDYTWDFGDLNCGVWSTDGKSKNSAKGPMGTHVFESPGVYTVTLTVKDTSGGSDIKQTIVNVQAFSGTTYYVSNISGNDENTGTSPEAPLKTFDTAMTKAATNTRILFRRGERFSTSSNGKVLDAAGPGIIGAYYNIDGSDDFSKAKPVITQTGVGGIFTFTSSGTDWRVMDLKLVGPGSISTNPAFGAGGSSTQNRSLVLRVEASNFWCGYITDSGGQTESRHSENFIIDSNFHDFLYNGGYAMFFAGDESGILGTIGLNAPTSHVLRVWHFEKMVIEHNNLQNAEVALHVLKLHSTIYGKPSMSDYALVSDNYFSTDSNWLVAIAPQNDDLNANEQLRNIVVERNTFHGKANTRNPLVIKTELVTVRNNIFIGTGGPPGFYPITVQRAGSIGTIPDRVSIYNNVFYRADDVGASGAFFNIIMPEATNPVFQNNLAELPSWSASSGNTKMTASDYSGSPVILGLPIISNNSLLLNGNANQMFNPGGGDFHLKSGSMLIDSGAAVPVYEDYDGATRPKGAGWDIGAFEYFDSPINASVNVSRTSCVAPCAVFFDAAGTTATTTSRPFHELDYTWNFGDSSSGFWNITRKSKNSAKGALSAHIFDYGGTYTVTLTVKDGLGNSASKQVSVNVQDANSFYSGTNTRCVSTSGNYSGCPSGASQNTSTNIAQQITWLNGASGRRLLLRRGESWTGEVSLTVNGAGTIGAYGTGNKPRIIGSVAAGGITINSPDWRVMDLDVYPSVISASQFGLVYRVSVIGGGGGGYGGTPGIQSFYTPWGSSNANFNTLADSLCYNFTDFGIYYGGEKTAIIGNNCSKGNLANGGHTFRTYYVNKMVISNNYLGEPGDGYVIGGALILKLHSDHQTISNIGKDAIISDNMFQGGASANDWMVDIGPMNPQSDERMSNMLVERNYFRTADKVSTSLLISAQNITIRNNIFEDRSRYDGRHSSIYISRTGIEPFPDSVSVYDNSGYSNLSTSITAQPYYFLYIASGSQGTIAKNSIASAPNTPNKFMVNDEGNGTVQSNNTLTNTPGFVSSNPTKASDFRLQSNSIAIDAGTSVPVWEDYDGNFRPYPINGYWDIGAYEYGSTGAEFCGNSYCNASFGETCVSCPVDCETCPDTTPPTAPTLLNVTGVGMNQINLSWNASMDDVGVAGYRVYRNNTVIDTTSAIVYSDNGLLPGALYRYNVTAYDASGKNSTSSNQVSVTTLTDTIPPNITSVTAVTNTSIVVVYNEQLNRTSAQTLSNYRISNGIIIYNAVLAIDNITLTLTTSMHGSGVNYILNVTGVRDVAGNAMSLKQMAYRWTATLSGLGAWWRFDDSSGSIARDSSGNGNDGTIVGTASWTVGKVGSALNFDGINNLINVPNYSSLDISGSNISITMWIYPRALASGDSVVIAKFWSASKGYPYYQYGIELTGGNTPTFYFGSGSTLYRSDMSSTLPYNQWSFIGVTYDGINVRWYKDAAAAGLIPQTSLLQARGQVMKIGADQDNTQLHNGILDEVRIYSRALSAQEISDLYNEIMNPICGDGICSAGENCSADASYCADNSCFEPTCINGCGQTPVAYLENDEYCLAPGYCDGAGNCLNSNYLIKVSSNGRYLEYQNGTPFMMMGDSPQQIVTAISESDAEFYLANRQASGFNTAWIHVLCIKGSEGCGSNGMTYDGIAPFTTTNDLATPNEVYFTRVDHIIQRAANHGIVVVLDPIETISWLPTLNSNGLTKARNYGRYLGNRYKNFDNIIWMSGNDFNWGNSGDDALVNAVALGIKDNDTRHIHTVEFAPALSSSIDDPLWASLIKLNAAYTYFPTYAEVLKGYNAASIPTFMVEANYEFESLRGYLTTAYVLRKQEYWTMLSGATGQLYGSAYTWPFPSGWKTNLDTPGSSQIKYVNSLFGTRRWYELVPDQTHSVVTAGYGTYDAGGSVETNDYLTAARVSDGTLVIAYMPTRRTITVNMSKMAGTTTARWYDPTNGIYTTVSGSPFVNSGTRQFTPTGNNGDGAGDWVLVLEAGGGCTDGDSDGWNATAGGSCGSVADCNDGNSAIHPGATEVCGNGIDEDCSGADLACGTFSVNTGRIVGASGNGDGKIALLAGTVKNVVFNFSANGSVGNLNDSSAKALFYKNGVNRMNSSCRLIYSAANKKTYGCTIGMWFYDGAGDWAINVNVSDNSGNVYGNNSEIASVEILREVILSSAIINFPGINPGNTNVLALYMPLNITNQGNYESNVSVMGHNLHGITNRSEYINVNNFRAGINVNVCSNGSSLVNGTAVVVSGSWLPRGASAKEELYYCLTNVPAVSTQTYSTLIGYGWRIGFLL